MVSRGYCLSMIPAILSISCHCEAYRVAVTLLIRHCERSAAIWVGVPGQACKNPVLITLTVPLITTPPGLLRRLSTPRNNEQWLQCFFLCHSCESRNLPWYCECFPFRQLQSSFGPLSHFETAISPSRSQINTGVDTRYLLSQAHV